MSKITTDSNWLTSLVDLPSDWALICCDGHKRPWNPETGRALSNWTAHDGLSAEEVQAIEPKAVGVLLGEKSGGLMTMDFDGPGAEEKFVEIFGRSSSELPQSISWTSGKDQRRQVAFIVDRELWPDLKSKAFREVHGNIVLEARWNGQQSVIAGAHPETDGYSWLPCCSPKEIPDPAVAPDWLMLPLLGMESEIQEYKNISKNTDRAIEMMAALDPTKFTSYWSWLRLGMALHSTDEGLLSDWINFCRLMPNFNEGECIDKWKSFGRYKGKPVTIASLHVWAKEAGYSSRVADQPAKGVLLPKGAKGGNVGKVSWLIEGFLARKSTVLLASEAGSGKSSLLMRAADAVEHGTLFLDQVQTNQGRVLFIQGDEPQHDTEAKLKLMELEGSCDYYFTYTTLDLNWFEEQTKKYDLIIIDSATSLLAEEGAEHEDAAFTRKLYRIGKSVSDNGSSCIITTHLKKAADGVPRTNLTVEDIAGRASIRNALQDYWGIYRNPRPEWESHFSLKCFGKRNCHAGDQWELQGDEECYWWGLQDVTDGLAPKKRRDLQAKINDWFLANPSAVSLEVLSKELNANYEHIRRVTRGMFQQGQLHRENVSRQAKGRPSLIYYLA